MIPGQTRCPTSEWNIEFVGLLMSEFEHTEGNSQDFSWSTSRSAMQYICVDDTAESELVPELISTQ